MVLAVLLLVVVSYWLQMANNQVKLVLATPESASSFSVSVTVGFRLVHC